MKSRPRLNQMLKIKFSHYLKKDKTNENTLFTAHAFFFFSISAFNFFISFVCSSKKKKMNRLWSTKYLLYKKDMRDKTSPKFTVFIEPVRGEYFYVTKILFVWFT